MNIFLGEFFGTFLMILLGNGVVANALLTQSKGQGGGWIVITAGWAFAVSMAVYAVGWASGAHLNPAVTIGLIAAGKTAVADLPIYIIAQFLGAMLGSLFVWISYFQHFQITENGALKLMCFCTKPAIHSPKWNLITEIIATAALLIGVLGIFNAHNGIGSGMGPYAIGILIFSIGLSLGGPTGFAINPARDLGPRIMHALLPIPGKGGSDWGYAWIPVVGPVIGSLLGAIFYQWLIAPLIPL